MTRLTTRGCACRSGRVRTSQVRGGSADDAWFTMPPVTLEYDCRLLADHRHVARIAAVPAGPDQGERAAGLQSYVADEDGTRLSAQGRIVLTLEG